MPSIRKRRVQIRQRRKRREKNNYLLDKQVTKIVGILSSRTIALKNKFKELAERDEQIADTEAEFIEKELSYLTPKLNKFMFFILKLEKKMDFKKSARLRHRLRHPMQGLLSAAEIFRKTKNDERFSKYFIRFGKTRE